MKFLISKYFEKKILHLLQVLLLVDRLTCTPVPHGNRSTHYTHFKICKVSIEREIAGALYLFGVINYRNGHRPIGDLSARNEHSQHMQTITVQV